MENKGLPKYQFERAIDGFLGAFLPQILEAKTGGRIDLVAQEFPLKKADNYQSTNVYVLLRDDSSRPAWIFVELKTDLRSLRQQQNEIYKERLTQETTIRELLKDVEAIGQVSNRRAGIRNYSAASTGQPLDLGVELVYLSPGRHELVGVSVPFLSITFAELAELEMDDYANEWTLVKTLVLPEFGIPADHSEESSSATRTRV